MSEICQYSAHQDQGSVIYSCRGGWSASKNAVNTFLLCSPAAQESPAQTSLFGRSPVYESSLDFRSWLAPVGSTPASLPARLSNQTTRPFNQSFTGLDDVVLSRPDLMTQKPKIPGKMVGLEKTCSLPH